MGCSLGIISFVRSASSSPFCESIVPTPWFDASIWTKNLLVKLGCCRIGLVHMRIFSSSNAWVCSGLQCQCYHLSKWPNCFHGTCSGLVIWQLRCTTDTLSGIRHVVPLPPPYLVVVLVTPNGS